VDVWKCSNFNMVVPNLKGVAVNFVFPLFPGIRRGKQTIYLERYWNWYICVKHAWEISSCALTNQRFPARPRYSCAVECPRRIIPLSLHTVTIPARTESKFSTSVIFSKSSSNVPSSMASACWSSIMESPLHAWIIQERTWKASSLESWTWLCPLHNLFICIIICIGPCR